MHLVTTSHAEGQYTLSVNNVKDRATNPNTILPGSQSYYEYTDEIPPQIIAVQALAEDSIIISFSEPVEKESAENISNYSINNGITINSAELDESKQIVRLLTNSHSEGAYTLLISNIKDLANTPNTIIASSFFNYNYVDLTAPFIISAATVGEDKVNIVFSESVEQVSAENIANYSISGNIQISQAVLNADKKTVQLTTSLHLESIYALTINNVKDRAATPNIIKSNSSVQYEYIDKTLPVVENVQAISETLVDVLFSESVEKLSAENISNYSVSNGVSINNAILDENLKNVRLTTSPHFEGSFTLTLNNIKDRAITPNSIANNSSYQYDFNDQTAPQITSVYAQDNDSIEVTFTEPIEKQAAETLSNYNINKGIKINKAVLGVNTRTVYLTTSFHNEGTYVITVNNIIDRASSHNKIPDNSTVEYNFIDKIPPEIANVEASIEDQVAIIFNEPVEKSSAENISNYQINGNIAIFQAELDTNLIVVHLKTSAHVEGNYIITMNSVMDRANNPNAILSPVTFEYKYIDAIQPEILNVQALLGNQVSVTFSEPVDKQTAENISNYHISNEVSIFQAVLDTNLATVHLHTSAHVEGTYSLTISNIKDRAENPNIIQAGSLYQYEYIDMTPPIVLNINPVDENQVDIMFNELVEKESAEDLNNYQINNGIVITSATLDVNGSIVHLITSNHQPGNYILVLNNVKDLANNLNSINQHSYFNYSYLDTTPPGITNVETIDATHLKVTFNEKIEKASAENMANFKVEVIRGNGDNNMENTIIRGKSKAFNLDDKYFGTKNNKIIDVISLKLDSNERIVHVLTTEHVPGKYELVVTQIKDKAITPNLLKSEARFKYEFLDIIPPFVNDVIIVDRTHVDIIFSESLNKASAENGENYNINNGINIFEAVLDLNQNVVHLTTSSHESGRTYNVSINNVYDLATTPNEIIPNSNIQYLFIDQNPDIPQPVKLDSINLYADGAIILSWQKSTDSNVLGYKIYYGTESKNYDTNLDAGNVLTHTITGLVEGQAYYFAATAYNTSGLESNFSNEQTAIVRVMDLEPPTIYTVSAKNDTELVVVFNEKVEKLSSENLNNYKINNGIVIQSAKLDTNQQSVQIVTSIHQPGEYEILINNIFDLAQSPNIIEKDSRFQYNYYPDDNLAPFVTDLILIDKTHVDVLFSENITRSSSENMENYNINNNITVYQSSLDQNKRTVHLLTSDHLSNINYILTINNICDYAFPPNLLAPDTKINYNYVENDNLRPEIYTVKVKSDTLLEVHFSEKIQQQQAEQINNYFISNEIKVLKASLFDNDRIVQLETSPHQTEVIYVLAVSNVCDLAQPANIIEDNNSYRYAYLPEDTAPPVILSAEAKDENHIEVAFSEMIDKYSAEQELNYNINKNVSIVEAKLDNDLNVVHLITTKLTSGENYTLTINNVKDIALDQNEILSNSTMQFSYLLLDNTSPIVENCYLENETNLLIVFNEIIDRISAENITNYQITNGIEIFNAFLDSSLKTVRITTSEHQSNVSYTLVINNIADRAQVPNIIAQNTKNQYSLNILSNSFVRELNRNNCQLAYLKVGDEYYVDQNYILTKVPIGLSNCLWIKTANGDAYNNDLDFMSFNLKEKSKIYVAFDSRALNYPEWLVSKFYRTGQSIGVTDDVQKLDVWAMDADSGIVAFGGNSALGAENVNSMYVVLVKSESQQNLLMPDGMDDPESVKPVTDYILDQNYPNPFNEGTKIRFHLLEDANVEIKIFNILGQTVNTLVQTQLTAGHHLIPWISRNDDGYRVPSGVYFVRMIVKRKENVDRMVLDRVVYSKVRKMLLIK